MAYHDEITEYVKTLQASNLQLEQNNERLQNEVTKLQKDLSYSEKQNSKSNSLILIKKEKKVNPQDELNKRVLAENDKMLKAITNISMKRHVKEEDEPVMKRIIKSFNMDYAKNVAGKSCVEILKTVRDEF